jgi:uncharacterized membrane protein YphA (DoxX/SURF4 family)
MAEPREVTNIRRLVAVLRITLGIILLVQWYDNLQKGIYTADGIAGLFDWIFNETGGGPAFYRAIIEGTILQAPGLFANFQLVAELLLGLGLLFGAFTTLAGLGALLFFLNLLFAYLGGQEWIWTYVLLSSSAFVVAFTHSGRAFGIDQFLVQRWGEPRWPILW